MCAMKLKWYHDKVRRYRSGSGTYDTIIANIQLLSKYASKLIRINVVYNNLTTIEELLNNIHRGSGYLSIV